MAQLWKVRTQGILDSTDAEGNPLPHSSAYVAVQRAAPAVGGALAGALLGGWLISRKTVSLPVGLAFGPALAILVPAAMSWFGSLNDAPVKTAGYHMFRG
jgi:hypothetical protein